MQVILLLDKTKYQINNTVSDADQASLTLSFTRREATI